MSLPSYDQYTLEFQITNFKSYFGDQISFNIRKPITVIAGPNGEGKSNLIEAMLIGTTNFLKHSRKFRESSFFNKSIRISSKPEINVSLYDLVFTDVTKKKLEFGSAEKVYPERFDPINIVSHRKRRGFVRLRCLKQSDRGKRTLIEMTTIITKSHPFIQHRGYFNRIEDFELLYLNPDTLLTDFFVKLVGQEFSSQLRNIPGTARKAEYQNNILKIFPEDNNRLICDIDNGKFEEIYLSDMNLFLTSNLASGAKKECMLYILSILAEKLKDKKDWLVLFLIDEIEAGLHTSRQKNVVEALISAFQENEKLRNNVKIVITTHSPIIYSELSKHPDFVDTFFVLRNPKGSSKIFRSDDITGDEFSEKRILVELGLNIYELPKIVVFVEGTTDKEFWNEILSDVGILPLWGASIPNVLSELVISYPLSRYREYYLIADKSGYDKLIKDIKDIRIEKVKIKCCNTNFNSLEEFIFDTKIDEGDPKDVWDIIEERVQEFSDKIGEPENTVLEINVKNARSKLEKKGKDGIINFFDSLKNRDDFYKVLGKHWSAILKNEAKEIVKKIKTDLEI